jgi:hypothetical protein
MFHPIVRFTVHIAPTRLRENRVSCSGSKNDPIEKAAANTPALVTLEDLDRAFPMAGKRTQERRVSFQTLRNCLDGVGT